MSTELVNAKNKAAVVSQPSRKPSRIPVRGKVLHQEIQKGTSGQEKLRKRTKSAEKTSVSDSHHMVRKVRSRHGSDKEKSRVMSSSVGSQELKENLTPALISSSTTALPNKVNPKSNMSYMELKRRHQHLISEIDVMEEKSKEVETKHFKEVHDLIEEISQCKESNRLIREEISSYQSIVNERNQLLDTLQQRLDDVKFENERMAGILEASKIDAHTGEKIERASHFQATQHETLFELTSYEQTLDDFISNLEATVLQLQEQKNKTENDPVPSSVHL